VTAPVVAASRCSKWYGHVLGVSDINWTLTGGVIGLLGPNGAGKSTLMKLMCGLLRPSRGTIAVLGGDPAADPAVRRRIGYSPEHESTYDELTGRELVTALAHLAGVPRAQAGAVAVAALETMGMTQAMDRPIAGYSKGMRQRTKLAATLAHDPDLLILDEPLTGVDPIARAEIIDRIRKLAASGKTVVVSSHVLYEIEALTQDIVVIYRGQVLAEGNLYEIRRLIDHHPHRIHVECDRPRELAKALAGAEHVRRLSLDRRGLTLETTDPDRCYDDVAAALREHRLELRAMTSPDNNLGAVFDYLTGAPGGARAER
jgi:ABC-2 type transport system ATP-binding protein